MKINSVRLIIFLCTILLMLFGGIILYKKKDLFTLCFKNKTQTYSPDYFINQLDQEYLHIKRELGRTLFLESNIYKKQTELTAEKQEYETPCILSKPSEDTLSIVKKIITEYGLDDKQIEIVAFDDESPAAANDNTIYINEKDFFSLSPAAQNFCLGHEIQHMIMHDDSTIESLERILGTSLEKLIEEKKFDHPLCAYSRFTEKRADILAALKGKEWADGYYTFVKEVYDKCSLAASSHPAADERLELAQQIIQYMNSQSFV